MHPPLLEASQKFVNTLFYEPLGGVSPKSQR